VSAGVYSKYQPSDGHALCLCCRRFIRPPPKITYLHANVYFIVLNPLVNRISKLASSPNFPKAIRRNLGYSPNAMSSSANGLFPTTTSDLFPSSTTPPTRSSSGVSANVYYLVVSANLVIAEGSLLGSCWYYYS